MHSVLNLGCSTTKVVSLAREEEEVEATELVASSE